MLSSKVFGEKEYQYILTPC